MSKPGSSDSTQEPGIVQKIRKRVVQVALTILLQSLVLFVSAGSLDWEMAWVYLGVYVLGVLANAVFLFHHNPELIAARAGAGEGAKGWDWVIGGMFALSFFVFTPLGAGLDRRFGWSAAFPLAIPFGAAIAFVIGFALFSWAMASNVFFEVLVRVQLEHEHMVVETGPYRFIRHPGYLGGILQALAVPAMLGSLWAFLPAGLAVAFLVARTALEDRTLRAELPGYQLYSGQVRYRLMPGVW